MVFWEIGSLDSCRFELELRIASAPHTNHSDVVSWGHCAKSEPINDWDQWTTHILVLLKEAASE